MKKNTTITVLVLATLSAMVMWYNFFAASQAQTTVNRIYGRFYQMEVVAESGQNGLNGIGDSVSINDDGTVAFVGQLSVGEGVFVRDISPIAAVNITPGFQSSSRVFGRAVQINNNNLVASRDRVSGSPPPSVVRVWDALNPGSYAVVALGGLSGNPYNSVLSFPSLNNNVTASASSAARNYVFGAFQNTTLNDVLVTPNAIPVTTVSSTRNETALVIQRPLIADDGKIIMRAGNSASDPIHLYANDFTSFIPIANSSSFVGVSPAVPDFGRSPGISDDGIAVAFYATLSNATTAAAINTNLGPGVFVSINDGSPTRKIIRVARRNVENAFDDPNANLDGICDPNESCINAELGVDASGVAINFADSVTNGFEKDSRVAVTHLSLGAVGVEDDSFVVSFIAKPNGIHETTMFSDKKGIWTVRIDVKKSETGSLDYEVSRPIPVIQIDDKIGSRTITGLAVYDQLARAPKDDSGATRIQHPGDHRVAFWASIANGASTGQIVVRATQLDSDEDALYDHWEAATGGIDFDGDGLRDLVLNAAPYYANATRKDIFVEVDYMPSVEPSDTALQQVMNAFNNAPAISPGSVNLHLMKDSSDALANQTRIGFTRVVRSCPTDAETSDFDLIKELHFGTVTERAADVNVLKAKRMAFRYALFAIDQAEGVDANGICTNSGSSGRASSILGDNLLITLGLLSISYQSAAAGNNCLAGENRMVCGQREAEAGTLMHELGHTLGLRHGGSVDDNHKPNYSSVMNYTYQLKNVDPNRPLDYSGEVLDPLNENGGLNEPIGVTNPNFPPNAQPARMVIWGDFNGIRSKKLASRGQAVDWNVNGDSTEIAALANINYIAGESPANESASLKTLKGFNDWQRIDFNFRNSRSFNHIKPLGGNTLQKLNAPTVDASEFELTRTQIINAAATFDADDDGIFNLYDNCPGTFNPAQTDTNGDGIGDACTFAPTAAMVSVSGRVTTANGYGLRNVIVELTDSQGSTRRVITSGFGFYRFDEVTVGETYVISVAAKRYTFANPTQLVTVNDNIGDLDFTTLE